MAAAVTGPLVVAHGWMVPTGPSAALQLPNRWTLTDLARLAAEHGHRTVYVHEWSGCASAALGAIESKPAVLIHQASQLGYIAEVSGGDPKSGPVWRWRLKPLVSGFICGGPAAGRLGHPPVSIIDLSQDESQMAGSWGGLDPRELLEAFAAFERLTGVPWDDSTGHTAERLILATHPLRKGGTPLDRTPVPEVLQGATIEQPWGNWHRPRTEAELALPFVHVFDANAQYLAAWGTVELGHGSPVHRTAGVMFDPTVAGFWRIEGADKLRNVFPALPTPWAPDQQWFSTPTMVRLLQMCDGLEVPEPVEAWTWPNRSRFLRAAAERLRDARASAMATSAAADAALGHATTGEEVTELLHRTVTATAVLTAVKDLYRIQTGRLSMHRTAESGWARPDWGHTIRAQARVNLHRRLMECTAWPFAILVDGLMYAAAEPDPVAFAQSIGLPLGDKLGQFHPVITAHADLIDEDQPAAEKFKAAHRG